MPLKHSGGSEARSRPFRFDTREKGGRILRAKIKTEIRSINPLILLNAEKRTRTSTPLRGLEPESEK
jgi:hypothetical protein